MMVSDSIQTKGYIPDIFILLRIRTFLLCVDIRYDFGCLGRIRMVMDMEGRDGSTVTGTGDVPVGTVNVMKSVGDVESGMAF